MAKYHDYIHKIDKIIGNKLYSLRLAKGLSRQELSGEIGVTHQQLQKYEKANNRISVGRLALIANALGTNIDYFYCDLDGLNDERETTQHQRMCIEVSRNFMKIQNPDHRSAVNSLVRSLI